MSHWKANISMILIMFGVLGYLIMEQHIDIAYLLCSPWATVEYGIIGEMLEVVIFVFVTIVCVTGMLIYVFRWWIIIAILIIWLAMITSRRN